MKIFSKLAALAIIPASLLAAPAMAQDSESYVINLNGSVDSNCELAPEGSGNFNVDMLETGTSATGPRPCLPRSIFSTDR